MLASLNPPPTHTKKKKEKEKEACLVLMNTSVLVEKKEVEMRS